MYKKEQEPLSPSIQKALVFATKAHGSQVRKYTGEPYVVHLIEVMMLVRNHGGSEEEQITALLHDTIEDPKVLYIVLEREFGKVIADMVAELSDQITEGSRAERKKQEAERLWTISAKSQTVKYADLISNTKSIARYAPDFAKVYLKEKEYILSGMRDGDSRLYFLAMETLEEAKSVLNME